MESGAQSLEQTTALIHPDVQTVLPGDCAEIDVPVAIEVYGQDRERRVGELQDLGQRRPGNRDDDARAWSLGQHDLIEYAVTVEVCGDRGMDGRGTHRQHSDNGRQYHNE